MIKENFVKIYENTFKESWDLPALSDFSEKYTLYYKDLAREITKLHVLFKEIGIVKGDKIALVGKNNIPWCVTYLATVHYGAVIVPILQDFHPDNIHHIIHHSDSILTFTSDQIWENLDPQKLPNVKGFLSLSNLKFKCLYESTDGLCSTNIDSLDEKMKAKYPTGFAKENIKYAEVDNSELVLINYTSGTTGFSKGVMLTANNLAGNIVYANYLGLLFKGQNIVSFLPLAHAYGCAFEFLFSLSIGAHTTLLGKTPTPAVLSEAFAEIKPNLIISVPLIFEKIYKKSIVPKIEKQPLKTLLKIPGIRNLIYKKIRNNIVQSLGGQFNEVIIGGAALNKEVEDFFLKIKFPLTVGYGMTECAPLISYDNNKIFRPRSCGRILDNIMEVRIDSVDPYNVVGEIQVKGENVMMGYYKNEEATHAVFTEDGWLKTGDMGTISEDNRIYIKGRCKSMILGPAGQNIYPEEIELKLNNMLYVMESIVVQRNNKLVALVHPDYEALEANNIHKDKIYSIMEDYRQNLNKQVSPYETVSTIELYSDEFEKTPKKSIKRYLYDTQLIS